MESVQKKIRAFGSHGDDEKQNIFWGLLKKIKSEVCD